jgi:hypothetical protein
MTMGPTNRPLSDLATFDRSDYATGDHGVDLPGLSLPSHAGFASTIPTARLGILCSVRVERIAMVTSMSVQLFARQNYRRIDAAWPVTSEAWELTTREPGHLIWLPALGDVTVFPRLVLALVGPTGVEVHTRIVSVPVVALQAEGSHE